MRIIHHQLLYIISLSVDHHQPSYQPTFTKGPLLHFPLPSFLHELRLLDYFIRPIPLDCLDFLSPIGNILDILEQTLVIGREVTVYPLLVMLPDIL